MNIKYLFVVSLSLFFLFTKNTFAQTENVDLRSSDASLNSNQTVFGPSDQLDIPEPSRTPQVVTPVRSIYVDQFKYRWYIQAGGGAQLLMAEDDSKSSFKERVTLAPSLTVGYKLNPIFGLRLNFTGGSLHGWNDGHSGTYRFWNGKSDEEILALQGTNGYPKEIKLDGIRHWDPQWNYRGLTMENQIIYDEINKGYNWRPGTPGSDQQFYMQHVRYLAANAAITMNLFDLFGNTDSQRKFDVSMHLGPTFVHVLPHMGVVAYNGFGANGGVQGQYHINNRFGVFVEANGSLLPDGFDGHVGNTTFDLVGQTLLGVTYKFPVKEETLIRRPVFVDDSDNDELNRIRAALLKEMDQLYDLQPEIDKLRDQLAGLSATKTTEVIDPDRKSFFLPDPVHFQIGKTEILPEAWTVIERVAEYLKANPDALVIVTGYADKDTGTLAINERLSRDRSKNVADALAHKFNISQNRIAIDWRGDTVQPFYRNQMNRAVLFYIEYE